MPLKAFAHKKRGMVYMLRGLATRFQHSVLIRGSAGLLQELVEYK